MDSLSHLYVAAHLDEMRDQAATARLAANASSESKARLPQPSRAPGRS